MAEAEEVNEWLQKANEDRLVSVLLLESGKELTLPCMFHLQQMLEKTLKALILVKGTRLEKTHDLGKLAQSAEVDHVDGLLDLCETINLFAVLTRYPGDLPEVNAKEAQSYFDRAEEVRAELLERISGYLPRQDSKNE